MSHPVLITQCLQTDFVAPVSPTAPLPNALHVGPEESLRLLGPDPTSGPVAQILEWARSQPDDDLTILHIRDWHDPSDPKQTEHLERFGLHCIQNTPGAKLVLGEENLDPDRERFVNSIALNDFQDTDLEAILEQLADERGPLRVGVIGVWTEAKVTFCLYDLKTRCRVERLATCSALTASASRTHHLAALDQLQRILGVEVVDSVGDFASWLCPTGGDLKPPRSLLRGARPEMPDLDLTPDETDLLGYLYRDCARLEADPLSGGYSGARVFRVQSIDPLGHRQSPSVAKIGPRSLVAKERVAFERVEAVLGNDAPRIRSYADLGELSGLRYSYAAMGTGEGTVFKDFYTEGAPLDEVERVLTRVFDGILGRFYRAAQYERCPLLDHYGFAPRYGPRIRDQVLELTGQKSDRLTFPGVDEPRMHVARFYERVLDELPNHAGESHFVSYVHGDLNGANILIDSHENVWLIDFFHTTRGHVLKDLIKLENDLLYIFTPLEDESVLPQAIQLTDRLYDHPDLRAPLPEPPEGVTAKPLLRAWKTLRILRRFVAKWCRADRNPLQMSIGALRYAVHTLAFNESSDLQKTWALATACRLGEQIKRIAERDLPLRIDYLGPPLPARLGMTICPGRQDKGRDLTEDLNAMIAAGVQRLVCLVTPMELSWAGVEDLPERAGELGLEFRHTPIADQRVPTRERMQALVAWIREGLDRGETTVVFCMGGLGRSGTVAACVLKDYGLSPLEAIEKVREVRSVRAIETRMQEDFIHGTD